jgi:hypothetical protein
MPAGVVGTVKPAVSMHGAKRRTRENRKSAPRNRTTNLNQSFKEKREKLFRKLDERYG